MPTRRIIILLSLLFPILTVGFIYETFWSLRLDTIPTGAYLVPWMKPKVSYDQLRQIQYLQHAYWNIDAVMAGSLKIDLTFRIPLPNGTRDVASTVYLGHDSNLLYMGGIFRGMYGNPTNNGSAPLNSLIYPNNFKILLDVDDDGKIKSPESGSIASTSIWNETVATSFEFDLAWEGSLARLFPDGTTVYGAWTDAQYICKQPLTAWDIVSEYVSSNGTLATVFARRLNMPGSCADSLQMRPGERWVMGFVLELGYSNGNAAPPPAEAYQDFVDGWPRSTYPYLSTDASWYPKLAIDLTNPPAGFTG